jgi:hypothetical protein
LTSASRLAAQEASPVLVTNAPAFGTFYWLSGLPPAPYPFDPARGLLPIWSFNGLYFVDDSEWLQNPDGGGRMAMRDGPTPAPGGGGGGGDASCTCNSLTNFTVGYFYSTNGLSLGIAQTTNPWIALTIQTATTNATYDVFGTTNMLALAPTALSRTNWAWLTRVRGGTTNFSWGLTNWCERYFQLGTMQDSDNDGVSDAYEQLVSKTDPQVANSSRAIYEGVISNQYPNNWFKLNNESGSGLTNAISGQAVTTLTNGGGAWDVDAFAIGNSAFAFNVNTQRLAAGDVISGGSGTNQGSLSLLFRSLNGYPTTTPRYVFCQKGNSTNEFSMFFEGTNSPPGSFKVQMAGQTNVILQSNAVVFGTWYYLAMTWNESDHLATWYLAPIGGTLSSGAIDLGITNVVGNSSNVNLGNRDTQNRAISSPGNGALDQIAFWNRELTNTEICAQFDTLNVLFQGPSKVFDLTHWELTLPVDETNQLDNAHMPLDITRGWLNNGFKYVDPADATQKYFYLSNGNEMVFEAPWNGADQDTNSPATSLGSPRSELRETLANGDEHNWVPNSEGGTHTLQGSCKVISGTNKVIIGQIHAKTPIPTNGSAAIPAVILSHNPSNGVITVTVKNNPYDKNADTSSDFAAPVPLGETINYTLQMVGAGTNVTLYTTVNNDLKTIPMTQSPYDQRWGTTNVTLYFKAGCYFPKAPTNGGTAKVTFSSLSATPQ